MRVSSAWLRWRTFSGPVGATFWGLLALILLSMQVAMTVMWRSQPPTEVAAAAIQPAAPVKKTPASKPAPPMRASLEIVDPKGDDWATKVEAVPIQAAGSSPVGFKNPRLIASRNGEPMQEFPLDANRVPAGEVKVDASLLEALRSIPNRSEFIRSAIQAALESTCPLCKGTGTLTPDQRRHWDEFAGGHALTECDDCQAVHLICTAQKKGDSP